jgi:hypothetical protein
MLSTLILLLAFAEYKEAILAVLVVFGAIIMWRTGLIQSITGGQKQLIELRSAELAQSREKVAELQRRVEELESYNRLLILNSRTTMEVAMQLKREERKEA